jgi:glucose 1-dehydrogenase
MMMRTLAQEVAPERIRINAIAPGAIRTPINREAWDTDEAYKRLLTLIPYGRIGEPEDIGRAAVWLASDASDYVVGTTLFVDYGADAGIVRERQNGRVGGFIGTATDR